ncbi:MAG: hypothetical protein ABI838_07335 [Chloroflexota bacterium]
MAVLIAGVSILGALAALHASVIANQATTFDQDELQRLAQQQQTKGNDEARIDEDLRLLVPYREHVRSAELLVGDAAMVRASDPALADTFEQQAQAQRALADNLRSYFFAAPPTGPSDQIRYERDFVLRLVLERDRDYQLLRPDATRQQAEAKHGKALHLVTLVTMFALALFFLTLAHVVRRQPHLFANMGATVVVLAIVFWVVIEVLEV